MMRRLLSEVSATRRRRRTDPWMYMKSESRGLCRSSWSDTFDIVWMLEILPRDCDVMCTFYGPLWSMGCSIDLMMTKVSETLESVLYSRSPIFVVQARSSLKVNGQMTSRECGASRSRSLVHLRHSAHANLDSATSLLDPLQEWVMLVMYNFQPFLSPFSRKIKAIMPIVMHSYKKSM